MRNMSVKWKITVLSGLCLIITSIALIGFSVSNAVSSQTTTKQLSSESVITKSQQVLETRAQLNAVLVQNYFDEALYRAEMLAQNSEFLKFNAEENFTASDELRGSLNEMVRRAVQEFSNVNGAYLVFQPNGLDGEDSYYHGADYVGSNEIGRFATRWIKGDSEEPSLSILSEADLAEPENGEKYFCPMSTGSACVSTPKVNAAGDLVSAITVPVTADDNSIGFLGIEISLNQLSDLVAESDLSLFDGAGDVTVVSLSESIIASSIEGSLIGQPFISKNVAPEHLADLLFSEELISQWNPDESWLVAFAPISVINQSWGILLEMPRDVVLTDANELDVIISTQLEEGVEKELLVGASLVIVGLIFIFLLATRIVKPIEDMLVRLQDIASGDGDLTQRIDVKQTDEIGKLAQSFNLFLDKLQGIIKQVVVTTEQVADTSVRAQSTATTTRSSSESQFKEVDMVATAAEEMTQTANMVFQNADNAVNAANQAQDFANSGKDIIQTSADEMQSLVLRMEKAVPVVEELATNNSNITEILSVIEGISEQTNLLALNAAIEAARAGEQGRGFAVVADEVRNLASRTQDSVSEIREVISQVQTGTSDVVTAINEGNALAQSTASQVEQAVDNLNSTFEAIAEINDMNSQIVRAAQEQEQVSQEVNQSVAKIRDLSATILEQAGESERVGENIAELSSSQQKIVSQFKV